MKHHTDYSPLTLKSFNKFLIFLLLFCSLFWQQNTNSQSNKQCKKCHKMTKIQNSSYSKLRKTKKLILRNKKILTKKSTDAEKSIKINSNILFLNVKLETLQNRLKKSQLIQEKYNCVNTCPLEEQQAI